MDKIKNTILIVIAIVVLSLVAYGASKVSEAKQVADGVSIELNQDCQTAFWNETETVMGECTSQYEINICDDEPINKSCHTQQKTNEYSCVKESRTVVKNSEICHDTELTLSVNKILNVKDRYKLKYDGFGKCAYTPGNDSAIIICDSNKDGNGDGICQPGESCIAFIVSKDKTERLYRNSRIDFASDDATFYQKKIDMEAAQ